MKKANHFSLLFAMLCAVAATPIQADNTQLAPIATGALYVAAGSEGGNARVALVTYSDGPVAQFDYVLQHGSETVASGTITPAEAITRQTDGEFTLSLPPATRLGTDTLTFAVTRVNGQPNSTSINTTQIVRHTVSRLARRRVAVEEFGRLWCGYCPRGLAAVENLVATYGDDCVAIAVHSGASPDALAIDAYTERGRLASGFPTVLLNGGEAQVGGITGHDAFERCRETGTPADFAVSARWDDTMQRVTVQSETTFRLPLDSVPYAVAYVLVHDSLTGYRQNNYYSGQTGYLGESTEFDYFVNAPSVVTGWAQSHVPVAALGPNGGLADSFAGPAEADRPLQHRAEFPSLAGNTLIQSKAHLRVCALLFDRRTGYIANAAQCAIEQALPVGIATATRPDAARREVARFTADGLRISTPRRGLNVVRYSDGTTRKEWVR